MTMQHFEIELSELFGEKDLTEERFCHLFKWPLGPEGFDFEGSLPCLLFGAKAWATMRFHEGVLQDGFFSLVQVAAGYETAKVGLTRLFGPPSKILPGGDYPQYPTLEWNDAPMKIALQVFDYRGEGHQAAHVMFKVARA